MMGLILGKIGRWISPDASFLGHRYLPVFVDIFIEWIEAYLTRTEKLLEIIIKLLQEVIA